MENKVEFTDPFYGSEYGIDGQFKDFDKEFGEKKEKEESSLYDFPAAPGGAPPPYTLATAGTGTTIPSTDTSKKVNWGSIVQNAPTILEAIGGVVGTAKSLGASQETEIKQACGRRPILFKKKKIAYQECVNNYLRAKEAAANAQRNKGEQEGMSTTTKILIGVGIFIFIAIVITLIIVLSRKSKEQK